MSFFATNSVICLASFSQVQKEEMRYKANVHHVQWLEVRANDCSNCYWGLYVVPDWHMC